MASFQAFLFRFLLTAPLFLQIAGDYTFDDPPDCNNKTTDGVPKINNNTSISTQDICSLPKERGSCDNYRLMFYFNSEFNECKYFFYGGCNGNANKFEKVEDCEKACNNSRKSPNELLDDRKEAEESALKKFSGALDKARQEQEQKHRQLLNKDALLLPMQIRYNAKNNLFNVKQRIHSRAVEAVTKDVASYSDAVSEHLMARDLASEHSRTRAHANDHAIADAMSAVLSAKLRLLTVYLENEKRASIAMSSALTKLYEARDALNQAQSDRDIANIEFENAVRHTQNVLKTDPNKTVNSDSVSRVNDIPGGCQEIDGSGKKYNSLSVIEMLSD